MYTTNDKKLICHSNFLKFVYMSYNFWEHTLFVLICLLLVLLFSYHLKKKTLTLNYLNVPEKIQQIN